MTLVIPPFPAALVTCFRARTGASRSALTRRLAPGFFASACRAAFSTASTSPATPPILKLPSAAISTVTSASAIAFGIGGATGGASRTSGMASRTGTNGTHSGTSTSKMALVNTQSGSPATRTGQAPATAASPRQNRHLARRRRCLQARRPDPRSNDGAMVRRFSRWRGRRCAPCAPALRARGGDRSG